LKNPHFLLLAVLPLIYIALQFARTPKAIEQFYTYSHLHDKGKKIPVFAFKRYICALLTGLGILFLIIALSGPFSIVEKTLIDDKGMKSDYVLIFDISGSMLSDDNGISRLEKSADAAALFIYSGDSRSRYSVVAFKGNPVTLIPLSSDKNIAASVIDKLSPDMFTSRGTAFSDAIEMGCTLFTEIEKTDKQIILFTDGEESVFDGSFEKSFGKLGRLIREQMISLLIVMPDNEKGSYSGSHLSIPDYPLMEKAAAFLGGEVVNISGFDNTFSSGISATFHAEKDYSVYMLVLSLIFLFSSLVVRRAPL
jgi:hypothetical protein